jgi:hypothetical protein
MPLPDIPQELVNLAKTREILKTLRDAISAAQVGVLPNGTVPFTNDQSMGGNKLTNVGAPTVGGDVTNKTYVDTADTAVKAYSDAKEALDVRLDGSRPMTGALNLNTHKINNVVDPTAAQDAATKNYVDTNVAGGLADQNKAEIKYTGASQQFTSAAYVDLTGVTITFILANTRLVKFNYRSSVWILLGITSGSTATLTLNVDGVDYPCGTVLEQTGVGVGSVTSGFEALTLGAGSHTAKLRVKTTGTAVVGVADVANGVDAPSQITVVW